MLTRRWCRLLFFSIFIGLFSTVFAQVEQSEIPRGGKVTRPALEAQLDRLARQLETVSTERDQLLRENKKLTDKISATKVQLQKGGNPLVEIQLQNDLKASRTLSDQIQALDGKIYGLTEGSVRLKRQLMGLLSIEIDRLSREADATKNRVQKRGKLSQILRLQKEQEAYQAQVGTESNELLLGLDITFAEADGPDEIQQKLAIIFDQQEILHTKIARLDQQIKETEKKLSLQKNMLELLRDIRRGEDDEFDLDRNLRIAELQEDIAEMETTLETLGAKKSSWQTRAKSLAERARPFSQ